MSTPAFSFQSFEQMPLIGILRKMPLPSLLKMTEIYARSGFTTLEVTMNSPGASEMIQMLAEKFPQLNVGAGTVCTLEDLEAALQAGASFIVTPILDEGVIAAAKASGAIVFPGAFTPTEVYRAWQAGADMVKLFPAGRLGPSYLKDLLAPLDQLKLIPVGGISLDNFTEFLHAGASGLGLGSQLFPRELIEQGRWDKLEQHFQAFSDKYQAYKS